MNSLQSHQETIQSLHSVHISNDKLTEDQHQPTTGSQTPTMTLLESLDPIRQQQQQQSHQLQCLSPSSHLTNLIDSQQQQAAHLVQAPHLHQLQPSHQHPSASLMQSMNHEVVPSEPVNCLQQDNQQQQLTRPQSERDQNQNGNQSQRSTVIVRLDGGQLSSESGGPIVQWLLENYEIAEGESLPRSTVYNHYLTYCDQLQMASVNAASFGKIIRSVFIGLKTRRLGTRGHSKYHYFGVRAKGHIRHTLMQHEDQGSQRNSSDQMNSGQLGSSLAGNTDNGSESDSNQNSFNECQRVPVMRTRAPPKRLKRANGASYGSSRHEACSRLSSQDSQSGQQQALYGQTDEHSSAHHQMSLQDGQSQQANCCQTNAIPTNGYVGGLDVSNHQNILQRSSATHCIEYDQSNDSELSAFLGANWSTLVEEHWPQREPCRIENQLIERGQPEQLAQTLILFEDQYKICYRRMIESLRELKFEEVEFIWRSFWQFLDQTHNGQQQQQHHNNASGWHQTSHQQETNSNSNQNIQPNSPNQLYHQIQDHDYHHQHLQATQQQQQLNNHSHSHNHNHNVTDTNVNQATIHPQLSYHTLYQLTSQPEVIEYISQIDCQLYGAIEAFLLPDILRKIPIRLLQLIRMFAKNFKPWLEHSIKDYSSNFADRKCQDAQGFSNALRRYTEINHLSTASRAIWEKRSALAQMSVDLSRLDLNDVEHQVSLMNLDQDLIGAKNGSIMHNSGDHQLSTNPNTIGLTENRIIEDGTNESLGKTTDSNSIVTSQSVRERVHLQKSLQMNQINNTKPSLFSLQPAQLIQNFLHLLEDPFPVDSWPDWCRNLVESRVTGASVDEGRNFLLKWNFYISLIMKELLLRRAPSCSSFHLIKLLFDAYIYYLVNSRLAQRQHNISNKELPSNY